MGQQHNKVIKRSRRKAYLKRLKEREKQGLGRRAVGKAETKKDAKKPAVKKAVKAPAKKVTKPAEENAAVEQQS